VTQHGKLVDVRDGGRYENDYWAHLIANTHRKEMLTRRPPMTGPML
jgi:hypothetical protein